MEKRAKLISKQISQSKRNKSDSINYTRSVVGEILLLAESTAVSGLLCCWRQNATRS